jgi:hypothetical protein
VRRLQNDNTLICTFPSGTGFVTVNLILTNGLTEVHKFQLDPEKSIEVPISIRYPMKD